MLTRLPPEHCRPAPSARESVWLLLLMAFAWLWPGVFSHDLWNPAEPQLFAVISETADKTAWLPTLQGEPYFQVAPVYVWLAKMWQTLLSPHWADAYAAARFASVSFTALGLTAAGMSAYLLFGRYCGRATVLILIGSAGMLGMGHFLGAMSVVFAGTALALWGMAWLRRNTAAGIIVTAAGAVLLGQSAGWLAAAGVMAVLLLWLRYSPCEARQGLVAALVGLPVCVLPALAVQLAVLAKTDAAAFNLYVHHYLFGAFGGMAGLKAGFHGGYYLQNLLWFAFPAWALAGWTAHSGKHLLRQPSARLLLCWAAVFVPFVLLQPQRFQDHLLLLLPALAVFGSARLDDLRRGVAAFLNWFGIAAFGAAALFLWLGFLAMNFGFPAKLAERAAYFSPDYLPKISPFPITVALLFTPLWVWAITRKHIRGRQAVSNWAAGVTLVWALLMTLFLPWLDAAKSYRPLVAKIEAALPVGECLSIDPHAREAALAWAQYATVPAAAHCRYRLRQYNPQQQHAPAGKTVWQGRRPRNKTEAFVLIDTQ